ncbi:MAG: hypothetical protein K6F79_08380 [Saccharofermentans sp.]|nr:hypothetical protein [Saccharofermentans sp.]
MDTRTESTTATVLRVIFAIIASFAILILTNCLLLKASFLNNHFWKDLIKDEKTIDLIREEIDSEFEDTFRFEGFDPGTSEQMRDDFIDLIIDDVVDGMIEGDTKIDEDRYYEFLDEYEDVIFGDMNLSSSQIKELKEEYIDEFQTSLDELVDDAEKGGQLEVFSDFEEASRINDIIIVVCSLVLIAIIVVLMLIHINKYRPVRALGIAMTVAESLNLLMWGFFFITVSYVKEKAKGEDHVTQVLVDIIGTKVNMLTFMVFLSLIAGIVVIIIGSIGASRTNETLSEEI